MTVLADCDIEQYQRLGRINIHPWTDELLQSSSYDLRLAPYTTEQDPKCTSPDCGYTWRTEKFSEGDDGSLEYWVQPDEFVLMNTIETVTLGDDVCAQVAGKSTWARHGLLVEAAGWVDPGFTDGTLTLEVKNLSKFPVRLTAGMPIAHLVFMQMRSRARRPYSKERNHYQGQKGPTPPWK